MATDTIGTLIYDDVAEIFLPKVSLRFSKMTAEATFSATDILRSIKAHVSAQGYLDEECAAAIASDALNTHRIENLTRAIERIDDAGIEIECRLDVAVTGPTLEKAGFSIDTLDAIYEIASQTTKMWAANPVPERHCILELNHALIDIIREIECVDDEPGIEATVSPVPEVTD